RRRRDLPDREPGNGERWHGGRAVGHHRRAAGAGTRRRRGGGARRLRAPRGRRCGGPAARRGGAARPPPARPATTHPPPLAGGGCRMTELERAVTTAGPAETEALGARLGRAARGGELLGLVGDLGAGKTCLVRGLAAGLGIDPDAVHSPTFVIATEYRGGRL